MQKQLIASAKEKGFESHIIGKSVEAKYSNKDFYYLWMCELQKWLREEHKLIVEPNMLIDASYAYSIYRIEQNGKFAKQLEFEYTEQFDYEQTLEEGLKLALKLI